MARLSNKTALITGSGSGLGRHTALVFAREGANVVVSDINEAQGLDTVAEIEKAGGKALFVKLNVIDEENWQQAVQVAVAHFGALDILINSAGIVISKNIEDSTLEDLRKSFALNVEGPFLGMKAAAEVMKERGGSIVNIASMSGVMGLSKAAPYSTSKGAVRLLSKSAAVHFAKQGYNIRVNILNPSYVRTPMLESVYSDEQIQHLEKFVPLGRLASLDDIANALLFLASDESTFITGFDMNVEGGLGAGN